MQPAEADSLEFEDPRTAAMLSTDESQHGLEEIQREAEREAAGRFIKKQKGSTRRKKQRQSRPAAVLLSIHSPARDLYLSPSDDKVDLSYRSLDQRKAAGPREQHARSLENTEEVPLSSQPASLYSILARYLDHLTGPHSESRFSFTALEQDVLRQANFTQSSVETWAACLLEHKSMVATSVFRSDKEDPPLFLLLLFLRRVYVNASAFGVVLRHLDRRVKSNSLPWIALKIFSVRLLRHARSAWPESIPWITAFFVTQTSALLEEGELDTASARQLSDLTRFSNVYLMLLSLPVKINPILGALHEEKAQFQVLQFMASQIPAITVTRRGFRAIARNQLAHAKTTAERDWAELKGPSWPPWKENRTAMDEDKGYEYGASRTSKILHRMYEAGYREGKWEEMVEAYAGWDTDRSPTIQTRTSLPHLSSQAGDEKFLTDLLWAARVRTTRTQREAWACFLACELSGARASQRVYLAMFEKLYYPSSKRSTITKLQPDLDEEMRMDEEHKEAEDDLLPGDMKEVLPDPTSPLHYVYLSEPVPTFRELYHRMITQNVRPSHRLLAFLIKAAPTFEASVGVLELTRKDFNGGIGHLLSCHHGDHSSVATVPTYILTAFIKMLCRHGHFHRTPQTAPPFQSPEHHGVLFRRSKHYLLEYAHSLLTHYRPHYRPAWAAYMEKVVHSNLDTTLYNKLRVPTVKGRGTVQYVIIWKLVNIMQQIDVDVDDEIFNLVCTATTFAAQAANQGTTSFEGARHVYQTGSPRLRKMFQTLVGANVDMHTAEENANIIPPHIPGPAELHAYVRALGTLHDYEGLYSFSTWLTRHHTEVTARAEAQHGGSKLLFRTLVALRAALTGYMEEGNDREARSASDDIVQLVRAQIESVQAWGGWPGQEYVDLYVKGWLTSEVPNVGGR